MTPCPYCAAPAGQQEIVRVRQGEAVECLACGSRGPVVYDGAPRKAWDRRKP